MNDKRNERLNQITEQTIVIGIDIAKHKHYAIAVDDRGRELSKAFPIDQNRKGFEKFTVQIQELLDKHGKDHVLIGFEPTGHYWMNLAAYLIGADIPFVAVNPMHVNRSKEFDDNSQTKNDQKDARIIAKLIVGGYFSYPKVPEGIEAELRNGSAFRWKLREEQTRIKNQITGWMDQYFPEFRRGIKGLGQLSCAVLKQTPLPEDLLGQNVEDLARLYKEEGAKLASKPKIRELQELAQRSIGLTEGSQMARIEIGTLIDQHRLVERRLASLDQELEKLAKQLPEFEFLLSVPGIGVNTVTDLLAETGSLKQYNSPRQIINLAGLSLRENSSGKHKGQKKLSKRGRRRLRSLLYKAIMPLLRNNDVFHELYTYYITRTNNPLKKKEAMVVLCGKLVKIFFGLSQHESYFNEDKMRQDLHCLKQAA